MKEFQFESISSFVLTYKFLKQIGTPYDEYEAYELGLIDEKGKKLKDAETPEEKEAMNSFIRMCLNIKRLMSKAGLRNQNSQKVVSLFLLKEESELTPAQKQRIVEGIPDNGLTSFNESIGQEILSEVWEEDWK